MNDSITDITKPVHRDFRPESTWTLRDRIQEGIGKYILLGAVCLATGAGMGYAARWSDAEKTKQEIVKGLEGLAYDAAESARHQRTAEGQDALLKLGGYAEAAADLINGHFRNVNSVAADQARWEAQLRKKAEKCELR